MTQTKIAIIGGGIVGFTTAYYLQRAGFTDITIFDDGNGQATKAAAGIISPWLSKRRNQRWFELAKLGAALYPDIVRQAKLSSRAYRQNGTIITRNTPEKQAELVDLAMTRASKIPTMGFVKHVSAAEIKKMLPEINIHDSGIYVAGGAQIDGANFLIELQQYLKIKVIKEHVQLDNMGEIIGYPSFDKVILAVGAWLDQVVEPLGLKTRVRPQKGQLIVSNIGTDIPNAPVLMPDGEYDYIPLATNGTIIGASHQDDMGFDLTIEPDVINDLVTSANKLNAAITAASVTEIRVGTRAYTPDFAPFFGQLPTFINIYVASGLGSSGLTTGPAIAYCLSQLLQDPTFDTTQYTRPINEYIYSR